MALVKQVIVMRKDLKMTKVCVYVNSEEELLDIYQKALDRNLPTVLIEDSGLTIGPAISEEIDEVTGHLRLL